MIVNKLNKLFDKQKNRDFFSGFASICIVAVLLLLLFSWKLKEADPPVKAKMEVAPPLDFKELNLDELKVESKSSSSKPSQNKNKSKSKNLTSNKKGGKESKSGGNNKSNDPFGGGNGADVDGFNKDIGDRPDVGDKPDGGGSTKKIERKLITSPSCGPYTARYSSTIVLSLTLNDDGSINYASVSGTCQDSDLKSKVKNCIKKYARYNAKTKDNEVNKASLTIYVKEQ